MIEDGGASFSGCNIYRVLERKIKLDGPSIDRYESGPLRFGKCLIIGENDKTSQSIGVTRYVVKL